MAMEALMGVGPKTFAGSLFLIIAIVLGIVSIIITYVNSRKFKGEVFEMPFVFLTIGMLFVTFSLFDVTFLQSVWSEETVAMVHDLSFILGFAFMLATSITITHYLIGMEKFANNFKKK